MLKHLLIILLTICAVNANELVDALKGKKSGSTDTSPKQHEAHNQTYKKCDEATIAALEQNNIKYFASKKGELKEINSCIIPDDSTPMMVAAYMDRSAIVRLFLDDGISANDVNQKGYSALHFAAFYGNYEVVKTLINAKADVNAVNDDGQTPLMIAAYYGNARTAKVLISSGADRTIKDASGADAYALALKKHKKEVLRLLK